MKVDIDVESYDGVNYIPVYFLIDKKLAKYNKDGSILMDCNEVE